MCGIVGYIGETLGADKLMSGLKRLEYRGYDSAGIAVYDDQTAKIKIRKCKGRLSNLEEQLKDEPIDGMSGIGHTRWATHGEPNRRNSHPHTDSDQGIAIVHNGIIENYDLLKQGLEAKGVVFSTETDTEVIAQLLAYYHHGDMRSTLLRVLPMLEGSFALAILDAAEPDKLFCARKDSPLIVGKTQDGFYIASDIPAMLEFARDVYWLDEREIAVMDRKTICFYDELGNEREKETTYVDWDLSAAEKSGYEHFMLKEIYEQPRVIQETLAHYLDAEMRDFREDIIPISAEEAKQISRITILACGTAFHAGLVGKSLIEKMAGIPVNVEIASEYRYNSSIQLSNELFIVVSQSGETADTIAAMRKARRNGGRIIAFCNVIGSTIAREADAVLYTLAGPEIAVASTKAYVAQLLMFELLALALGRMLGRCEKEAFEKQIEALKKLPEQVQELLDDKARIQQFANQFFDCKSVFFLGRLLDFASAQEAALKLKEISYIHSESYAAGELKHGTIALLEEGTLVVALCTQAAVLDKMKSNIEEVRVRGAAVLIVAMCEESRADELELLGKLWRVPQTSELCAPILTIVPMQLFSYFMALEKGCDIDKPRNLAKSVTVE